MVEKKKPSQCKKAFKNKSAKGINMEKKNEYVPKLLRGKAILQR